MQGVVYFLNFHHFNPKPKEVNLGVNPILELFAFAFVFK
jgi:hypothetical protein